MSRTFAILEVAPNIFDEIQELLLAAGYEHAFIIDEGNGRLIDMHGIALKRYEPERG
jgi:hypothetical protein